LDGLVRPHASLKGAHDRRLARLAAALLLALLLVVLAAFLFPDPGLGGLTGHRLTFASFLGMAVGYGLVRSGHLNLGVLVFLGTVEVGLSLSILASDDHVMGLLLLSFFCLPIAVAGILLPVRAAIAVVLVSMGLSLALEGRVEGHGLTQLDGHGQALMLLLGAVSVVAVLASWMAQRQARLLHENAQLLRQVTENIPEVMFIVAGDGSRMLYTSPAYEPVMGRTVAQSMADPWDWLKAVHPDDLEGVRQGLAAKAPELRFRIVHPTQGVKHIRARTFPTLGPDGKVETLVGIAEDVTATVVAEQRLREAQRQRIHLLQQLAHDMASPLSPVKIQLRLLRGRVGPEGENGLAIVQRNVEHIQRLVEDVKDVARLEGGDLKLRRQRADLRELARQAVESLAPAAAERQVRLDVEAPAPLPVDADAGRVTQVLYNLVGNALKFTPPGGRIEVAASAAGGFAGVRVRDTGAGMRPDQLERLFKPFSQVHDTAAVKRPEDKGSGLGLYISKGIVEAHGGSIAAESGGPGQGSTFTFRLALAGPP
jgi:signal transduction histidine kinase